MKENSLGLFETPILLIVFNRLDTAIEVFSQIKILKPKKLYIASDGPRSHVPEEKQITKNIRLKLIESIDWDCEIKTLFRDVNLGCKIGVSSSIDWFFENEEQGIILEDDCVPSQSFFFFCEELLNRYKNDPTVSVISGDGRVALEHKIDHSYDYINYSLVWGWASWRRVWEKYDVAIRDWPENKKNILNQFNDNPNVRLFWNSVFNNIYKNKIDTWDYQLTYLLLKEKTLCIIPQKNLITNIGFGHDATHTFDQTSKYSELDRFELEAPYKGPKDKKVNFELNNYMNKNSFFMLPFYKRLTNKLLKFFRLS